MANLFYNSFRSNLLDSGAADAISFPADTIKVVLIDETAYTRSASHQYLSDVPAPARIGTPQTLAGKTTTAGVFDANDVVFSALVGPTVQSILIYKDTGVAATSPLICLIDTVSSGLPTTPTGSDITVVWDSGGNGIFRV